MEVCHVPPEVSKRSQVVGAKASHKSLGLQITVALFIACRGMVWLLKQQRHLGFSR
jgi:hypothetical protein